MRPLPTFLICLLLTILGLSAQEPGVSATLNPPEINLGEAAELQVSTTNLSDAEAPEIPKVEGLQIRLAGNQSSQQVNIVNGRMSSITTVTFVYHVIPMKAGDFTIAPISVKAKNQTFKSAALSLKVSAVTAPPPVPTMPGQPTSGAPAPSAAATEISFMKLSLPERGFYAGEQIPMTLKFYLRADVQGDPRLPEMSSQSFTMAPLGQNPDQGIEKINGVPYHVLTWNTTIGTVKSGDFPLSASMNLTVALPSPRTRQANNPFNDPFFDQIFNSGPQLEARQIRVTTPPLKVTILPLPEKDKPTAFSGAIGSFQIASSVSTNQLTVGDPVTVKTTLIGSGNFDRITDLAYSNPQGFKSYPPSVKFDPTDKTGFSGRKIFEQILVPQSREIREIPPLSFSYFDPEAGRYVSLKSEAIAVMVQPGSATPSLPASRTSVPTGSAPAPAAVDLVSNKLDLGNTRDSLSAFPQAVMVAALNVAAVLAALLCFFLARHRESYLRDPDRQRSHQAGQAVAASLSAMDRAISHSDTQGFFAAARASVQHRLSASLKITPSSITLQEIDASPRIPEGVRVTIRQLFETADATSYSGDRYESVQLQAWKKHTLNILKNLENLK
ncbi:MAG: BatD family protein [Verrucomicrobiae bacterium]|nr:BatD family protein [Verrucomicrobiae bacterium]